MDHVNKTLLLSLKQDLLSLNESIEYLNLDKDIASWLFPTKNYQFVKNYIEEKNVFEVTNVKIFLELLIDRLYVGIRLILAIIQDKLRADDFENKLIFQPQQMTIGCSFENLRKSVDLFIEKMADNDTNSTNKNQHCGNQDEVISAKKNGKTQTDIVSMNKCDSCASALSCMKNLLMLFEIHKGDIYKTEQIQSNIYDITQFGCMIQTTATIEKSLKILLNQLLDKQNDIDKLNKEVLGLNKELQRKNGRIVLLEQECGVLNEKNKKDSLEMANQKSKIENLTTALTKSDSQINSLTNSISSLNLKISVSKKESKLLLQQKLVMTKNFDKIKKVVEHIVQKLPVLETNLSRIEKEHHLFSEEFGIFGSVLDNLNRTLMEVTKNHNGLENKVKILYCDSIDNMADLVKNFKSFYEKLQQLMIQSHINDVKAAETIPKIKIKGNPVEDISRQIDENNERIRMLQNENIKLENIVSKFKNLKK